MPVTVRWFGDDFRDHLYKTGVRPGMLEAATALQRRLVSYLSRSGTGKHWPGSKYRSSAPGRPPTPQTGRLRNSIQIDQSGMQEARRRPRLFVGTNIKGLGGKPGYPFWLEYGLGRSLKGKARPWMRPVWKRMQNHLQKVIGNRGAKSGRTYDGPS